MNRKLEELYQVKYFNDEIQLNVTKGCLQPWNCQCSAGTYIKCGYTAEEAHKFFIDYYQRRVDIIKQQTVEQFLRDHGIYK